MIGCAAVAIGIHLATYHFDRDANYNEFNPGAYVACDEYVAGVYYNSEKRTSVYVGYQFVNVLGPIDIIVGVVTGYERANVAPLLLPSVKWNNVRLSIVPPVKDIPSALHLSLEF